MYTVEKDGEVLATIVMELNAELIKERPAMAVYVRPETNRIDFEQAIAQAVMPYGEVIYMANLNGRLFQKRNLMKVHYPSQYYFASAGRAAVARYPEICAAFEVHFGVPFGDAEVYGAFEAVKKLGLSPRELFETFVGNKDFLKIHGQSFKKIGEAYVINYDMPCLMEKHHAGTNIFVMALALNDDTIGFQEVNRKIFEQLKHNSKLEVDENSRPLAWFEQMRRSYHISRNHLMALFDLRDFVCQHEGFLPFSALPFGRRLLAETGLSEEELAFLKNHPVQYVLDQCGRRWLVHILEAAADLSMEETIQLVAKWRDSVRAGETQLAYSPV